MRKFLLLTALSAGLMFAGATGTAQAGHHHHHHHHGYGYGNYGYGGLRGYGSYYGNGLNFGYPGYGIGYGSPYGGLYGNRGYVGGNSFYFGGSFGPGLYRGCR